MDYTEVNSNGLFNTPVGKTSNGKEVLFGELSKNDLRSMSVFFQSFNIDISCSNYTEHNYSGDRRTTFAYFDPPYPKVKNSSFVSYSSEVFNDHDFYSFLNKIQIDFMCSYSFTESLRDMILKDNFICYSIKVNRSINSDGKKRTATELFFMNYFLIRNHN